MNLVNEQNSALAETLFGACLLNCFAQVLHAREHGGKSYESHATLLGEQFRQRRLACARRSPKNQGWQSAAAFEQSPQNVPLADEMALADKLGKRPRAHPFCERGGQWGRGRLWFVSLPEETS